MCPPLLLWGKPRQLCFTSVRGIIETSTQTDILHLRTSAERDETDSTAKQVEVDSSSYLTQNTSRFRPARAVHVTGEPGYSTKDLVGSVEEELQPGSPATFPA
jgi:hypothetical protein